MSAEGGRGYAAREKGTRLDAGPRDPGFDWLPDAVAEAKEWGNPVVYRCDREPHPATRRLMDALGVRVEVKGGFVVRPTEHVTYVELA